MPVYQASTNQGCEVTFYQQSGAPGCVTLADGRTANSSRPALLSCHVQMALGGTASFGLICKPELGDTFFKNLQDDDWVDIVFTKDGKRWHVLRGLIDEIRFSRTVSGNGAITKSYSISGRSFQKIFEDTSVYLNIGEGENVLSDLAQYLANKVAGPLQVVQKNIIYNVLKFLSDAGRGAWNLPNGMPNSKGQFYTSMQINTDGVANTLPRQIRVQPFQINNGQVWSLAQQYSDPMYTELFCDQVDLGQAQPYDNSGTGGKDIANTAMSVIIRDRPFIAVDSQLSPRIGKMSPWFSLAKGQVDRQAVVSEELGRSGRERYNSFNATQGFDQVLLEQPPPAGFAPLWSPPDMFYHGLRRLDSTTGYSFDLSSGLDEKVFDYRKKALLKDWYCLNTRYYNGTISLGTGAPHLHIGTRLFIPGRVEAENFTGYIEALSHSWQAPGGTKTQVSVTRGYFGTDADHLTALNAAAGTPPYQAARYGL